MDKLIVYFFSTIFAIGLVIVTVIWEGFAIYKLWEWFIVSTFGLPVISIPIAIGISLFVNVVNYKSPSIGESDKKSLKKFGIKQLSIGFSLLIGYVVKTYFM